MEKKIIIIVLYSLLCRRLTADQEGKSRLKLRRERKGFLFIKIILFKIIKQEIVKMKCQIASIYNDAFQLKMQMILACTHASINECIYVHCMMITQNHNKFNNKKYNFIVVFARTPHLPSSLRRLCCGPVVDVVILRGSSSQRASRLSRAYLAPS